MEEKKGVVIHLLPQDFQKVEKLLKIAFPDLQYFVENSNRIESEIKAGIDQYL